MNISNSMTQQGEKLIKNYLEIDLDLGRASVTYADEKFTLYLNITNISDTTLFLWDIGISPCADLEFYSPIPYYYEEKEGFVPVEFLKDIISSSSKKDPDKNTEIKKLDEADESEIDKKLQENIEKIHYINRLKTEGHRPWELSSKESYTIPVFGNIKSRWLFSCLFFRPDKYKLNLYVDYSDVENRFFKKNRIVEVDILASIRSIIIGAAIGGVLGTLGSVPSLKLEYDRIILAVIFSILTVIALSRKTGVQTLITIQDFWGGVLLGFLVGYCGEPLFELPY